MKRVCPMQHFLGVQTPIIGFCRIYNPLPIQNTKRFTSAFAKLRAPRFWACVPDTKRIAKEIAKGDADAFLALCGDTYYEELLIKGFVLGFQKKPLADKRENLDAFVLQIDNWAVCDGFCAALKPKQTEYPYLYDWCCVLLQTKGEYTRRTAIVLLMDYLLCDEYIDRVLEHLRAVHCDCYYVRMAVAWCLSMSFVQYREKTLALLMENAFDKETHNKAIQKCIDSYRVSAEDKAYLRTLKR